MVRLRSLLHWCTALLIFAQSAFAHTEPVEPDERVFTDWRGLCQAPEEMTTCRMLQYVVPIAVRRIDIEAV